MRGARRRIEEEDEESVFVPMTDMTVSFLFIVIILLAFFASQFKDDDSVSRSIHDAVVSQRDAATARADAAEAERDRLERLLAEAEAARDAALADLSAALAEIERLRALLSEARTREAVAIAARDVAVEERDVARAEAARLDAALAEAVTRAEEAERALAEALRRIDRLQREIELLRRASSTVLQTYLAEVALARASLLARIRNELELEFPDLEIRISSESDALRFEGEGLFRTSSAELQNARARDLVERIAEVLDARLPCYTLGPRASFSPECNPAYAIVEAVLVEGHTDDVGADSTNLTLSAARGAATLNVMLAERPGLLDHENRAGQPVIGMAGYGESRRIDTRTTPEARRANRRIDLRIIMYSPRDPDDVAKLRRELEAAMAPADDAR